MLALTTRTLATSHRSVVAVKRPLLTHYRQFLASSSSTEITEATWYTTPPAELHTVCECLCILRGAIPPPPAGVPEAGDGRVPTPWPTLKRIMSRYDFKSWLASMSTSVASIDIVNARRVENIIRMDATITYERLRDVSMAGYRLLIIVAAALQSVTLLDEIATSKAELTAFEAKYDRARKFLFAVGGLHLLPPPATVDR
ncbi:hypothetical protein HK105_203744 [Polyrhizophydium stewartii]|uniref:Uncharacterized protein n=1 Tax=Polyrhizophydium stewartii TaxID=2732419 RepID=A0ABR4NAS7_9FUNG|nr:hypothetical protein HK105_004412 [Polyrhizophydium stewartii]